MAIDAQALLARPPLVTHHTLTKRDTILYALGVGATALDFVYEDGLKALPTMAVVMAYPGFIWRNPELGADWTRILHGEQSTILHAPLPVEGELTGETRIEALYDKGADKGAIAIVARTISDASGTLLATSRAATFLRGDGGFATSPESGSSDGMVKLPATPDRAPDTIVTLPTAANQALLYRLSGDLNPLHIDPAVAQAGGFARPILHGLCSYGIVGRALLAALCANDPARMQRMDVRFSAPVYPGETIETSIWQLGDGRAAFSARVTERNLIVMSNGIMEFA